MRSTQFQKKKQTLWANTFFLCDVFLPKIENLHLNVWILLKEFRLQNLWTYGIYTVPKKMLLCELTRSSSVTYMFFGASSLVLTLEQSYRIFLCLLEEYQLTDWKSCLSFVGIKNRTNELHLSFSNKRWRKNTSFY